MKGERGERGDRGETGGKITSLTFITSLAPLTCPPLVRLVIKGGQVRGARLVIGVRLVIKVDR